MVTWDQWDIDSRELVRRLSIRLRKWLQPRKDFNFYYYIAILLAC